MREDHRVCRLLCWHTLIELPVRQKHAIVRRIVQVSFAPAWTELRLPQRVPSRQHSQCARTLQEQSTAKVTY